MAAKSSLPMRRYDRHHGVRVRKLLHQRSVRNFKGREAPVTVCAPLVVALPWQGRIDAARRWSGAAESNGSDCWAIVRHPNHAWLAQLPTELVLGGKRKEPRLKMEAQMAIPQWHDLTQEEQQAIAELYTGFTSLLTACMAERLKALGLAEQKVGGTGLTEQGRELFESR
jgi:hypothetical protein